MSIADGSLLLAAPVAIAAGAISFASPCVLPLVPGYLSYVTGMAGAELGRGASMRRTLAGATLFVAGFSAVFISYGALFGSAGATLRVHQRGIEEVLGVLTVLLGLAFGGVLSRVPWLSRELRVHRLPAAGLLGAPVLGVLFAVGWTPCIGPTLAAVLGLAASGDTATAGRGALLVAAYCAGLGVPFLLAALGMRRALGLFAAVKRHYRLVMGIGGLLLVTVGVLEITGTWSALLLRLQHSYSYTPAL